MHIPTLCDWFSSSASDCDSELAKTQFSLDSKNGIVSGITEKNQNAVFTRSVKFKASDYDSDSFVSENKP